MSWRQENDFDDESDELGVGDEPDAADVDDDNATQTIACPICQKLVYEGADICPHCRNFIIPADHAGRHSRWIVMTALMLLVVGVLSLLWMFWNIL